MGVVVSLVVMIKVDTLAVHRSRATLALAQHVRCGKGNHSVVQSWHRFDQAYQAEDIIK